MPTSNITRGLLFKPGERVRPIELVHEMWSVSKSESVMPALYRAIAARTVEKITVAFGVDIIMDEEGLFQEEPVLNRAWVTDQGVPVGVFGAAVIIGADESRGEWRSLSLKDGST